MTAVLATVPAVGTGRVALVVTSTGLAAGTPWTVTLDGRPVAYCDDRRIALATIDLLRDVVNA